MPHKAGDRVGDYEIVGELGAGGMGKVYRVRNVISEREDAMKILLPNLTAEPELADRFMREIKTQARLHHPNIAQLNTAFHYQNELVMIMELVDGMNLQDRLKQGPLTLEQTLDYTCQVLRALNYAHKQGVIHRDIKPANMIVTGEGVVKLLDFGIAKAVEDRKLTMTGMAVGSLHYMSPEQVQGMPPDPRSDIYSLGVTLYQFATGKRPIDGDSDFAIMSGHMKTVPAPPIELDPKLPQAVNDIILMSLAKEPEKRFQTAEAFLRAIESVQRTLGFGQHPSGPVVMTGPQTGPHADTKPLTAPATPLVPMPPLPPRSNRALYMILGAVAALVILGLAATQIPKFIGTHAAERTPIMRAKDIPAQTTPEPAPQQTPVQQTPAPAVDTPVAQTPAPTREQPRTADRTKTAAAAQATPVTNPPMQTPAQTPPVSQAPMQTPAAPTPSAPNPELEQIQDSLNLLTSRMAGVNQSIDSLARSQAAQGVSPSGDITSAQHSMQTSFAQAQEALRAGDAAAAKKLMNRAEQNLEKLEKKFGR